MAGCLKGFDRMGKVPAPCGTVTAYNRHLRRSEEPCVDCLRAKREDQAAKRAKDARPVAVMSFPTVPESASRVADLKQQRELVWEALRWASSENPRVIPQLSKELREINAEIDQIEGAHEVKETKFDEFFSGGGLSLVSS